MYIMLMVTNTTDFNDKNDAILEAPLTNIIVITLILTRKTLTYKSLNSFSSGTR